MLQGGDPTGTGKGGESCWKKDFADEFNQLLRHSDRGMLAMANRGKNTNSSQFYITYRSCAHLNDKHTVFGKITGGRDVLTLMEMVETDKEDRPKKDIMIESIQVMTDPFEDYRKLIRSKKAKEDRELNLKLERVITNY
jgi:peptidyl-prolyl cis-trans isomerase-like protein 2